MGNYDAKLSQLQAQEKQIESSFQLSLAEYRKANVIARPNHKLPTCFERTHTITDHYHFAKKAELEINPQITSMLEDA